MLNIKCNEIIENKKVSNILDWWLYDYMYQLVVEDNKLFLKSLESNVIEKTSIVEVCNLFIEQIKHKKDMDNGIKIFDTDLITLEEYVGYNINFEEAKDMNIYKYSKYIEDIKKYFNDYVIEDKEVIAYLEFGNICIELNIDNFEGKKSLDYYVSYKCSEDYCSNGEWYSDYEPLDDKVDLYDLEKDMFNCLIKYEKENK
uniref:hypothetical protein n=1 Tax=Clostridium botulinum TaxID=1491 RepID=UPI000AE455D4